MKMDQIAFYAHTQKQKDDIKRAFGLLDKEWINDTATGVMNGRNITTHLSFNYDLGIEFEILKFENQADHWHPKAVLGSPFMSHIGIHVDEFPDQFGYDPVAEMFTRNHTNTYLIEKRRTYHYKIYRNTFLFGNDTFLKFIKRREL